MVIFLQTKHCIAWLLETCIEIRKKAYQVFLLKHHEIRTFDRIICHVEWRARDCFLFLQVLKNWRKEHGETIFLSVGGAPELNSKSPRAKLIILQYYYIILHILDFEPSGWFEESIKLE